MKVRDALAGVRRVFLYTAPIIYYVQRHVRYHPLAAPVFDAICDGTLTAVTSSITFVEALVHPFRTRNHALAQGFRNVICDGVNTEYVGVDGVVERAAALRATHRFGLADAFQAAVALESGCEAFLTNDRHFNRLGGIPRPSAR
jgi:predicted nucleic acid-binding protein